MVSERILINEFTKSKKKGTKGELKVIWDAVEEGLLEEVGNVQETISIERGERTHSI